MTTGTNRQEAVFELVRGMSKAEKRNFKLFASRSAANQDAKFIALFDALDSLDEYDEAKVLKNRVSGRSSCPT